MTHGTPTQTPVKTVFISFFTRLFNFLGNLIALALLLSVLVSAAGVAMIAIPGPATEKKTVIIPKNSGTREIGRILAENGIVHHALQFALPAHFLAPGKLRAGEYEFAPQLTVMNLIEKFQNGETVTHKISIPEGLTSAEIVTMLQAEPILIGDIKEIPAEGMLLPETYHYNYGDTRADMIARMAKLGETTLGALWLQRAPDLPFNSLQQARIMASIVEKETGKADERPRVAGVFINRLRQGIKLQSDPTVIYALTEGKAPLGRPLTHADLSTASPYNTYENFGLPPAPIANPGRAALEAVLHPEKNDFIYFVADGTGGHAFAKTLDEHNANVARWRKIRSAQP